MCLIKVQRDENILDSDIMIHTAKYDQNETGNGYASVFYCGIYVTLWDIILTFQIFHFILVTNVCVNSGPASRRCNKAFYIICVAGIFWIRSLKKKCFAFSLVFPLNLQVQLMLSLSIMKYSIQVLQFMCTN